MNKVLIADAYETDRRLMSSLLVKHGMSRLSSIKWRLQKTRWRSPSLYGKCGEKQDVFYLLRPDFGVLPRRAAAARAV